MTALTIGDEVVAALLDIKDCTEHAITWLATPGLQLKSVSPSWLVIDCTLKILYAKGSGASES